MTKNTFVFNTKTHFFLIQKTQKGSIEIVIRHNTKTISILRLLVICFSAPDEEKKNHFSEFDIAHSNVF